MSTKLENTEINTNNSQNVSDKIPVQIIQKEMICRSTDIGEIINKKKSLYKYGFRYLGTRR